MKIDVILMLRRACEECVILPISARQISSNYAAV